MLIPCTENSCADNDNSMMGPYLMRVSVQVAVRGQGLNFKDVLNVLGMYPGDPGPPGLDCAGVVTAVGEGDCCAASALRSKLLWLGSALRLCHARNHIEALAAVLVVVSWRQAVVNENFQLTAPYICVASDGAWLKDAKPDCSGAY